MEKKTVNVSERLMKSIFIGLLIGILIVFFVHFFGEWSARGPANNNGSFGDITYPSSTKIPSYFLTCPFNELHIFEGNGASFDDVIGGHFSSVKFGAVVSATFDGHWKNIFIIGLIAAVITYFIGKVNFKIVKE